VKEKPASIQKSSSQEATDVDEEELEFMEGQLETESSSNINVNEKEEDNINADDFDTLKLPQSTTLDDLNTHFHYPLTLLHTEEDSDTTSDSKDSNFNLEKEFSLFAKFFKQKRYRLPAHPQECFYKSSIYIPWPSHIAVDWVYGIGEPNQISRTGGIAGSPGYNSDSNSNSGLITLQDRLNRVIGNMTMCDSQRRQDGNHGRWPDGRESMEFVVGW